MKNVGKFILKSVNVVVENVIGYSVALPIAAIIIPVKMVHDIYDGVNDEFQKAFKQQTTEQNNKTNENIDA